MDIRDIKEEKVKIEFEIAEIIRLFEEKTETKVSSIFINNFGFPYIETTKTVTIGLDIN